MSHPNCLIVFVSPHGHTARIVERLAAVVTADGVPVQPYEVGDQDDIVLSAYGAVVIGAPVHDDHHPQEMVDWLRAHRAQLELLPTALFSVSLVAADPNEEARAAAQGYIDELRAQTGLQPTLSVAFGGMLQHDEHHLRTRSLLRLVTRRHDEPTGAPTPVEDVDYTDWAAVERFGHQVAALVPTGPPVAS